MILFIPELLFFSNICYQLYNSLGITQTFSLLTYRMFFVFYSGSVGYYSFMRSIFFKIDEIESSHPNLGLIGTKEFLTFTADLNVRYVG